MSITEKLKEELVTAIKDNHQCRKDILRVVLGEVGQQESRTGVTLPDDKVYSIIRKIISSNEETEKSFRSQFEYDKADRLDIENFYLSSFLPVRLTRDKIKLILEVQSSPIINQIKTSKSDGQAVGIAMKFFKENKHDVDGNDVKAVVGELRLATQETI